MKKGKPTSIETFFGSFPKYTYKKGEIIIRAENQPAGVMYLTLGFVRMYVISESGEMLVLHVFRPGSFFPLTWALNDTPNHYFFEAIAPVQLRRAPREDVREFLMSHPGVLFDVTTRLLSGTSGILARMEHLVLNTAYQKTVKLLLYIIKHFGIPNTSGEGAVIRLTHREIAAWIGTTRETASLQIETLARRKLISYKGRALIIHNMAALAKEIT